MNTCPICDAQERPYFRQLILGKHDVQYFFCDACGFLHTEKPYWLDEAYSDAIARSDTGLVQRNLAASVKTAALFKWLFDGTDKFIDLAGGYGLLTRLMRDMGFDYYWSDRYAQNVLARGFEASQNAGATFRAATAFEVLEHVERPVEFLQDAFKETGCEVLFFSTELYSGDVPSQSWWYYGLSTGQHISFYSERTLQRIASILNLHVCTNGSFHLLSREPVNQAAYRLLTGRIVAKALPIVGGRLFASRVNSDHMSIAGVPEVK
jgi:hypothetical protein